MAAISSPESPFTASAEAEAAAEETAAELTETVGDIAALTVAIEGYGEG